MKITFLLTQDLESPSGLGRYLPLARQLAHLGYKPHILAMHSDYQSVADKGFKVDGVQVKYVSQMHVLKRGNHKSYFNPIRLLWTVLVGTWKLTLAALMTPTDVYHIGKPHPMNGLAGLIAAKLKRKPVYLDCDDYEAKSNRFNAGWQQWGVAFIEDHLPFWVDGITTNTHFTQNRLQSLGVSPDQITYVPNGVNRSRFVLADDKIVEGLRKQLGLDVEHKVVLYLGSLSLVSHPVDLLIKAFPSVLKAEPNSRLIIVGGGEDYQYLQELAVSLNLADIAHFTGRVPPVMAVHYFRLAHLSVDPVCNNPIAQARYPLKVVESIASSTPVLTSDVGDRRFILPPETEMIHFIQAGSISALAEGIIALLAKQPKAKFNAEKISNLRIYWDQLIDQFIDVYRNPTRTRL